MVTDRLAWSEELAAWLRDAVDAGLPVLGICYGHQLLAQALGGAVDYHAQGIEIGTVPITLTPEAMDDPILAGAPAAFHAHVVHGQTVTALPKGSVRLAFSDHEPTHAFRIGAHAWGVQFHPEFSTSIMKGYIRALGPDLAAANKSLASIVVMETPAATQILHNFGSYAAEHSRADQPPCPCDATARIRRICSLDIETFHGFQGVKSRE